MKLERSIRCNISDNPDLSTSDRQVMELAGMEEEEVSSTMRGTYALKTHVVLGDRLRYASHKITHDHLVDR